MWAIDLLVFHSINNSQTLNDSRRMEARRGRGHGAPRLPDKLGFHRVVQRHEHLRVLPDLTHHILEGHEEGEGRRGRELGLPAQIDVLLLRLLMGSRGAALNIGVTPGVPPRDLSARHAKHTRRLIGASQSELFKDCPAALFLFFRRRRRRNATEHK